MFKKVFHFNLLLTALICLSIAFPPIASAKRYYVREIFTDETIASTGTATSDPIDLSDGGYFGVSYQAVSSASAPDLKIELEMSHDDNSANFAVPVGFSDIVTNLTAETVQIESVQPPPMRYGRFKVTGNAGNAADTVLNLRLFIQES